jgi:hypothetical protein
MGAAGTARHLEPRPGIVAGVGARFSSRSSEASVPTWASRLEVVVANTFLWNRVNVSVIPPSTTMMVTKTASTSHHVRRMLGVPIRVRCQVRRMQGRRSRRCSGGVELR